MILYLSHLAVIKEIHMKLTVKTVYSKEQLKKTIPILNMSGWEFYSSSAYLEPGNQNILRFHSTLTNDLIWFVLFDPAC